MDKPKNIYAKLLAITTEMQVVPKNLKVQQTKQSSYQAVSERDILDAVKPLEAKYGIYSYPARRTVLESNMLESESTYNNNVTKKTTFMTRIETIYRFVNVDNPDEYIETTVYSEGIDSQDKGSGKAMTYADKYALMKVYKISTGDDPDKDASKDENYKNVSAGKSNNYKKKPSETDAQLNQLYSIATANGFTPEDVTLLAKARFKLTPVKLDSGQINYLLETIVRDTDIIKKWVESKKSVNNES